MTPNAVGDVKVAGAFGGELVVDGKPAGPYGDGVELTIETGEHFLEVRDGPRLVARGRTRIEPGGRSEARLAPVAPSAPGPPLPPAPAHDPPPVTVRPQASAWPWALGGAAAAGLAGAGAFWALREGVKGDLEKACAASECPDDRRDDLRRGNRYGTLSAVSLGVGVAAGAGLAIYLLTPRRPPPFSGAVVPLAGGAGGEGPCTSDAACGAAKGAGSLCVGDACTAATTACPKTTLVVVADGFAGQVDAALAGACFSRQLDPALAAVVAGTTTQIVAYAAALTVAAPLSVPEGVTLEGRTADAKVPVALAVTTPAAGAPLVTMGSGGGLKGFARDGKATAGGVKAEAGAVRLEGPLTIANATRALDLGGTVDATVTGTQAAPVLIKGNRLGIVVGPTAKLVLTGDGDKGGVTVEGTTAGAGVLVLAGGAAATVRLEGLFAKDNKVSTVNDGTGAVEVRQGRSVLIKNGVFEANLRALTLNGELSSDSTAFSDVVLEGNRFTLARPGQGSTICGSQLGSQTELNLGPGNVFPLAMTTCLPAQLDSCNGGADVGHDTRNAFALVCGGT